MSDNTSVLTNSRKTERSHRSGRSAAVITSLVAAVVVLAALLVFVAQNSQRVQIRYLSADTSINFGVAMLLAAVAGAVIALLVASIVKVRRSVRSRH